MNPMTTLEQGRAALDESAWQEAYEAFGAADYEDGLSGDWR